ncbi:AAA family ATPase [Campylobacter hyointestinalis]|uniref:Uncharacterized conserved protein n=1 Tax=Campylobacter hyointestinalis subsp. hyointestinalis TaxID=91352 RepID=A0A9W5APP6_CAMHY|nr:AAA family ATPase [Campylobacter hyointestinalis]CUU74253.1 Uncharacterized conserved protein [Campylobacter hyointestinalis subsp. hyointestinalis]CUU82043.1 Uncharacterized conserved protein [Campylobacter hyointestinalis subsp. hyointestinalis]
MKKQTIIIKKLGPIQECKIDIKKFTVLIGESGAGKSVILRTISLIKWIYKKMQYKILLKKSNVKSDALRFRLDGLLRTSMLEDFFTKDTYIEYLVDGMSLIVIENGKLTPKYREIKRNEFLISKVVFLSDTRVALPEILSSAGGRKAKFSFYIDDMIDNFYLAIKNLKDFSLSTMDIKLSSKKRVGYNQFFITTNQHQEVKFENASSGEKSSTIIELVSSYYANKYDFSDGFSSNVLNLIVNSIALDKNILDRFQDYIQNNKFENSLTLFIEEPEANLFPINQNKLAKYLSSLRFGSNSPEVIIATHSPYILTALNSLLYASTIIKNNPNIANKVYEIINKNEIISNDEFCAYIVGNNTVKSLINEETNLIDADEIDIASNITMDEFDKLLALGSIK